MMTGCGHAGVLELLEYARRTFQGGECIHAIYGGLHISPFEGWDEERETIVQALRQYDIQHLGCNHCTGQSTVRRMIELGMPVVRGTAQHGSKTDLYLGNGDALDLGGDEKPCMRTGFKKTTMWKMSILPPEFYLTPIPSAC